MRTYFFRRFAAAVPILALGATLTLTQPADALQVPQVPAQANVEGEEGVEVLARGPLHEAFASTAEQPAASEIVKVKPPESIEELPPDQKPDGDNVQWIPGYWDWDEDRTDYIWISGFWRVVPPGRIWVPGSWREAKGGYQWAPGFWSEAAPVQPNQEPAPAQLEYLPPPPVPLELAPSTPQPTVTSFYVPGSWMYRTNRYAWRPGYWCEYRPNWVWVPACYRWSPLGYIHIGGYWDYTLANRGVLFAPVAFRTGFVRRPNYYYTPAYMVPEASLYSTMFVRRGYGGYYFGDYYEQRYYNSGYVSWAGVTVRGSNFAVTVGVGRPAPVYDPLWSHYAIANRNNAQWSVGITNAYVGRYDGTVARPPRTLVQQNTIVKNTTINNTTIINNNPAPTMVSSFRDAGKNKATPLTLKAVDNTERVKEQKFAREIQQVAVERKKQETTMADRGLAPKTSTDTVRAVKLDIPKNSTVRAQVPTTKAPPPAPTATTTTTPVTPKPVDPVTPVPVDPKNPKPKDPKNPKPVDPKTPVTPVTPPVVVPPVVVPPKPVVPITPPVVVPPKPVVPVTPPVVVPPKPVVPVTPPVVVPPKPVVPVTPPVVVPPKPVVPVTPPVVVPPKPVVPVTPPVVVPPKPVVPVTPPVVVPPKPVVPVTPPVVVPPRPPVVVPPVVVPPRPPVVVPPVVVPPKPVVPVTPPVVVPPRPPVVTPPVVVPPKPPVVTPKPKPTTPTTAPSNDPPKKDKDKKN